MSFEQLIVAVNPGYVPVRCKVCDYRWESLDQVPERERTVCPQVFFAQHSGGEEGRGIVRMGMVQMDDTEPKSFEATEATDIALDDDDDEVVVTEKFDDVIVANVEEFTSEDLTVLFRDQHDGDDNIISVELIDITGLPLELLVRRKIRKFYCIVCDKPTGDESKVCPEHAGIIRVIKKKEQS